MRRNKTPPLVNLAIYTTITIFLWIFFDVYRALRKTPNLNIDNKILEPVNPNLNKELLNEINDSTYFDEKWLNSQIPLNSEAVENNVSTSSGNTAE